MIPWMDGGGGGGQASDAGKMLAYLSAFGNVPLQALEDGLQERMYFLLGCVRYASGKYDLVDRECDCQ